ncbi:hypothetical protein ACFPK5_07475 [Streptomyces beijiangensis]|uniref:hypothetical protein n=1 Tax=Streptomyces beijiangensis TaxID=163361 RepID=UPI00362373A5
MALATRRSEGEQAEGSCLAPGRRLACPGRSEGRYGECPQLPYGVLSPAALRKVAEEPAVL